MAPSLKRKRESVHNKDEKVEKKRTRLSIAEKVEVIKKLENGISAENICIEYGIKKQTVSDIKKTKENIKKHALKINDDDLCNVRKVLTSTNNNLDEAVFKWFLQMRSSGLPVRGIEIQHAALRFAQQFKILNFKASSGWLFKKNFCKIF